MRLKHVELWLALAAIAAITIVYVGVSVIDEVPAASGLFGHSLGVVGFLLMLMTEVLYSLRKRYMQARWGKLQHWLSFHIFTGLVGPYMVLLHSSWKFNGLAGVLTLLTLIIVISGFIGRYFYTEIPRDADGTILEVQELAEMIALNQAQLQDWQDSHPELVDETAELLGVSMANRPGAVRRRWRKLIRQAPAAHKQLFWEMEHLWERQIELQHQLGSMAGARRLLAVWHTLHVPLALATFAVGFIHIGAALYYATLSH